MLGRAQPQLRLQLVVELPDGETGQRCFLNGIRILAP